MKRLFEILFLFAIGSGVLHSQQHPVWYNDSTAIKLERGIDSTIAEVLKPDTTAVVRTTATSYKVYRYLGNNVWFLGVQDSGKHIPVMFGRNFIAINSGQPQFYKIDHVLFDTLTLYIDSTGVNQTDSVRKIEYACYNEENKKCRVSVIGDQTLTFIRIYVDYYCVIYRLEDRK